MQCMIFLPPVPVHVIVDHVPATPGLPIWATTLISAGIGAVFGILSGTLMEFLKPMSAKFLLMRKMKPQLMAELRKNMKSIAHLNERKSFDLPRAKKGILMEYEYFIGLIDDSRFSYYLEKEPLAVYEFDTQKQLQSFYRICKTQIPEMIEKASEPEAAEHDTLFVHTLVGEAYQLATAFLGANGDISKNEQNKHNSKNPA
jgi:hypothetical protein